MAEYTFARFQAALHPTADMPKILPPLNLSVRLVIECEHAVSTLVRALKTPSTSMLLLIVQYQPKLILIVQVPWDAERYGQKIEFKATGQNLEKERVYAKDYPPLNMGDTEIDYPITVVDENERLLAWYLPNILTPSRQV